MNKVDPSFVVPQETKDFLFNNQSIFTEEFDKVLEKKPYLLGKYHTLIDQFGNKTLHHSHEPSSPFTPTPDHFESENNIGDCSTIKISNQTSNITDPLSLTDEEDGSINLHKSKLNTTTL